MLRTIGSVPLSVVKKIQLQLFISLPDIIEFPSILVGIILSINKIVVRGLTGL